jgi:hypothetical protein
MDAVLAAKYEANVEALFRTNFAGDNKMLEEVRVE